jgi:hypothetical protein|nr:MAG TPA: hypothetical protein [Caudoviricetes sp.]
MKNFELYNIKGFNRIEDELVAFRCGSKEVLHFDIDILRICIKYRNKLEKYINNFTFEFDYCEHFGISSSLDPDLELNTVQKMKNFNDLEKYFEIKLNKYYFDKHFDKNKDLCNVSKLLMLLSESDDFKNTDYSNYEFTYNQSRLLGI